MPPPNYKRARTDMLLNMQQRVELFVGADHCEDGLRAVAGDIDRRRENQVLVFLPPAANKLRQHDAGGQRRSGVLLRDEQQELADHLLPDFRGVSAEEDRGCVTCPSVLPKHRDWDGITSRLTRCSA